MQIHRLLTDLHTHIQRTSQSKGLPTPGWILMNMSKQSRHKTLLVWVVPLGEFSVWAVTIGAPLGSTSSSCSTASKASAAPHRSLLLRARVRPGDTCAMCPAANHLLPPLPVAGLLQSAAFGLDRQKAGGQGSQEAAAAVNGQCQVHG